jgi:hypothetical protein
MGRGSLILSEFYINTDPELALELTELSMDELESIVGRFKPTHHRPGQLKGLLKQHIDGTISIHHHFHKHLLWSNN